MEVGIKIINLCKHPVTISDTDGNTTTIEPSGVEARVSSTNQPTYYLGHIPVFKRGHCRNTYGLPAPQQGVYYIVSNTVACENTDRLDILSTGIPRKDENGITVSCYGLMSN